MDTYFKFIYELLNQVFKGVVMVLKSIWEALKQMFNFPAYRDIISKFANDFSKSEWVFVVIAIVVLLLVFAGIILLIVMGLRRNIKLRKKGLNQEELLDEIGELHNKVIDLTKEKEDILAMKVSQIGLSPEIEGKEDFKPKAKIEKDDLEETEEGLDLEDGGIRFPKLHQVDLEYADYSPVDHGNDFTLEELCHQFRNFAASRLGLYYTIDMMRLFVSSLGAAKLVILQGISGTGKTSLAYAWGKFVNVDSCVASVQPSWRDRTELFGYFNEFTKKFNETDVLKEIYEAGKDDEVHTIILDEMNIARVEYYFAEMLSILEMPNKDEWIIELVSSAWKQDPKQIKGGKLKIAPNIWYIGTINNDDSTFMVTDKVYDRAMPIDINTKGEMFEAVDAQPMNINYTYLNQKFEEAFKNHPVSQETLDKIVEMDDYVIKHFRIAFGNRILKQLNDYVPVYVACGGEEIDAVDYFMARKVLRKFEQLNVAYIRDEIDPFINFLNKLFGKDKMKECIEYCELLKKIS